MRDYGATVLKLVPSITGCAPMTHDATHDAETDEIVAELEKAGLVTVHVRDDGQEAYTLTEQGERVARQMAMSGDEEGELLAALVESTGPSGP